jgi:hypothetical protein
MTEPAVESTPGSLMRFNPADSSKQRTCDADQWKSFSLPENVFSDLVYLAAHPGNQFRGSGGRWEGQYGDVLLYE